MKTYMQGKIELAYRIKSLIHVSLLAFEHVIFCFLLIVSYELSFKRLRYNGICKYMHFRNPIMPKLQARTYRNWILVHIANGNLHITNIGNICFVALPKVKSFLKDHYSSLSSCYW